jgi:uncharacterized protein
MTSLHEDFVIKPSKIHGNGLFAKRGFDAGVVLFRFEGQNLSGADAAIFSPKQKDDFIQIGKDLFLNMEGMHSFFINSSCRPNTYIKVLVNAAFIQSIIPIKAGDEITRHYSLTAPAGKELMVCNCGISYGCHELIGGFDDLNEKAKGEMRKFLPEWKK